MLKIDQDQRKEIIMSRFDKDEELKKFVNICLAVFVLVFVFIFGLHITRRLKIKVTTNQLLQSGRIQKALPFLYSVLFLAQMPSLK